MTYTYTPQGVCSKQITIDINDDETIESISFLGGCHGNLQGISALAKGRSIDEIIAVLRGIDCRGRGTSCPDQLANALEQIKAEL
ncbi:MAG: TIGR03905 family TSCPD domain-containing protein [Eubacterium sp.]|nr:TIGR03905 family TSCPD domain-containing protein [Eubacterium sp.]